MKNGKNLKRILAVLLAACLLAALAGCGKAEEEEEGLVLDDTISGEVLGSGESADDKFSLSVDFDAPLNPITTTSKLNQMVDNLVYDRLFEVDENFNVSSRILSDWYYSKSEGGSGTWILTVRPDILMHDGEPLTADDVYYSLSRVFTSGASYYQQMMSRVYVYVYGNEVYLAGDYSNGLLPERLSIPIIRSATNSILENVPVGSGPYMYSDDGQKLVKFDGYEYADSLPVDTIYLRQYEGPEQLIYEYESALVDLVINDPTNIYNMGYGGTNEKRSIATSHMHFLVFNTRSSFFRYENYRVALTWLIDRDGLVKDVLDDAADATALPIHPNSALFDADRNAQQGYNPSRGLAELERGGCRDLDGDGMLEFALSGNKVEININILVCADNADKVQAAEKIAQDLEKVGLHCTVRAVSWSEYIARLRVSDEDIEEAMDEGEFDWDWDVYYGEIGMTGDWNFLTLFLGDWEKDGTLNYGQWSLTELEDACYAFLAANDDERPEAQRTMLQSLAANAPLVPLCFEREEVISHIGVIKGMTPNQYNVFCNIHNWTISLD